MHKDLGYRGVERTISLQPGSGVDRESYLTLIQVTIQSHDLGSRQDLQLVSSWYRRWGW